MTFQCFYLFFIQKGDLKSISTIYKVTNAMKYEYSVSYTYIIYNFTHSNCEYNSDACIHIVK